MVQGSSGVLHRLLPTTKAGSHDTQTYPTDDQIEIVRLRHELAELVDDVERIAQRFEAIDDATAAELIEVQEELEAILRRLRVLDVLADDRDGSAGRGVIR